MNNSLEFYEVQKIGQDQESKETKTQDSQEMEVKNLVKEINYEPLVSYRLSLEAKIALGEENLKEEYSKVKNELLSYKGVKSRISFKKELFYKGRKQLAIVSIKGKHVNVALALDYETCKEHGARVVDLSRQASYAKVPSNIKITSQRQRKILTKLIEMMMNQEEILPIKHDIMDYAKDYRGLSREDLIACGKIKIFRKKEVNIIFAENVGSIMFDKQLSKLNFKKEYVSGQAGKKSIINIDTISKNFLEGDIISLETLKKKKLVDKKTTQIKVLARGSLDKALIVKADFFSKDAIKMIILTGGDVVFIMPKLIQRW